MSLEVGLQPGQLIARSRYRLDSKLGQGGFGVVWKGWDTRREAFVAVKTLLPSLGSDRSASTRFRREIATAARLNHPNIVQIIDTGRLEDGRPFFSMEFLDGLPLERFTSDLGQTLDLFDQLLEALAYAHARGVIHRDLKPDNIIVIPKDSGLELKLLDFGIAMIAEGFGAGQTHMSVTRPGLPVGTVPYMSPEQASGEPSSVGPSSDLYSVGVMLYEIVSGRKPFEGDWMFVIVQHVSRLPEPLEIKPGFNLLEPKVLTGAIDSLLSKEYSARPECAAHVRQMLAEIRAGVQDSDPHASAPELGKRDTHMPTLASSDVSSHSGLRVAGEEVDLNALSLMRMHDIPVVGREAEQEILWSSAMRVITSGRAEASLIISPPDRGKSRLARWLAEELHQSGQMRVLNVFVGDGGMRSAMHSAIYRWLRLPKLERQSLLKRIDEVLQLDHKDRDELCEFLLVGNSPASQQIEDTDEQPLMRLWQKFVWRVTERPSKRPLLVWIDGPDEGELAPVAQWLDLLLSVARLGKRPLLVMWTLDIGGDNAHLEPLVQRVADRDEAALVHLSPLSELAQEALARYFAPDLSQEVIDLLKERAMGNPLFLREMLLDWLDEGMLQNTDEGLKLSHAAESRVPVKLKALLHQRLAHFLERVEAPQQVSRALMTLAYLGQTFPVSLVQEVFEGTDVAESLLLQDGFMEARPGGREQEMALSSRMLRDALVAMARNAGVEHLLEARAVGLRMASGLKAMIHSDWEMAERCLSVAWSLLDGLEATPKTDAWRMQILDLTSCMAFRRREADLLRSRARAIANLSKHRAPPFQQRLQALLGIWLGAAALLEDDFKTANERIEVALMIAGHLGDLALEARALHSQGRATQMAGDQTRALELLGEAALTFRRIDKAIRDAQPLLNLFEADAVSDQAAGMAEQGDLAAASVQLRMLLGLYQSYGDRQGEAHTLTKLARIARQMGQTEQVKGLIAQAHALLQAIDDRWGLAVLKWEEATALLKAHELERADLQYRSAERLFATLNDKVSAASCTNARGEIARQRGQLQEAVEHYQSFREVMISLNHTHGQGLAEINMGWCFMAAREAQAAQRHFHAAYDILNESGPKAVLVSAMVGYAWASVHLGEYHGALNTLENAANIDEDRAVMDEDTVVALDQLSAIAAQDKIDALSAALARFKIQR